MLCSLLLVGTLCMGGCAGDVHTWVTEDLEVKTGSTTQVKWTRYGHTTEMTMQGDVAIAGTLDDIQSIPADGHFELTETNGRTQRLRVVPAERRAAEDSLSYRYTVDGQSQSFGNEERRWLRRTLHQVARKTGIGVEQRVAHLFEKGGTEAVFEEVRRVDTEQGLRFYYSALIRLDAVPMTAVNRALRQATQRLDSDNQMGSLLEDAADRYVGASAHFDAYEEAVRSIDSDYWRRQALTPLVARTNLASGHRKAVLKLIEGIDSDYEKRQVLAAFSTSLLMGPYAGTFTRLLEGIDSDYHKRQVLAEFMGRDDLSTDLLGVLLKRLESLESDYHKRQLLASTSSSVLSSARAGLHFLSMIDSGHQKRQAFGELVARDDLSADGLVALLEQVQRMEGSEEKAELLQEAAHLRAHDNPAVRKAYQKAVMSIVITDDV